MDPESLVRNDFVVELDNRVIKTHPYDSHTGNVEGLYPTPHIHEQMTAYIMATTTATLSTMR